MQNSNNIKYIIFFLILVILAGLSGWQIFSAYKPLSSKEKSAEKPVDTDVINKAADIMQERKSFLDGSAQESTNSAQISKNPVIQVRILNGSGVSGAASSLSNTLEEIEGISVVSVGNSESTDTTVVQIKSNLSKQIQDAVVNIVDENYEKSEVESLDASVEEDVVIILGRIGT